MKCFTGRRRRLQGARFDQLQELRRRRQVLEDAPRLVRHQFIVEYPPVATAIVLTRSRGRLDVVRRVRR